MALYKNPKKIVRELWLDAMFKSIDVSPQDFPGMKQWAKEQAQTGCIYCITWLRNKGNI